MHNATFPNPFLPALMTGKELATTMRYSDVTSAFRAWLKHLGIKPVPGRHDIYDPRHVRHQLDVAQGILQTGLSAPAPTLMTKTEERRARRGA